MVSNSKVGDIDDHEDGPDRAAEASAPAGVPAGVPARRRRSSPAVRRETILAAAAALIATSGYNGVSVESVARACGITRQLLLYDFPSKEHLLLEVLERRDRMDEAALLLEEDEAATDPVAARAAMTRLVERNLGQRHLIQLYTVLAAEALDPAHPAHQYFRDRLRSTRAVLADRMLAWHPRPDAAAVELISFLDGLQLNWLREPGIDVRSQWADFADRFFLGRA